MLGVFSFIIPYSSKEFRPQGGSYSGQQLRPKCKMDFLIQKEGRCVDTPKTSHKMIRNSVIFDDR